MGVLFSLGLGGRVGTVAAFDEEAEPQNLLAIPSHQFAPPFRFPAPFLFFPFYHNP
jgi:hypothetical protein